jgi:hypothetical protein
MAGAEESTTATAEAEMNIALSPGGWDPSFEFAFDAKNFSNRVLRVEVVASDGVATKRRRKEKGTFSASPPAAGWILAAGNRTFFFF